MRKRARQNVVVAAAGALAAAAITTLAIRSKRIDLAGKVVLITGGSRGLGLVLAREFASRDARVAVCARDEAELVRVRQEFAGAGDNFLALCCDVSNREKVSNLVRTIRQEWGRIDVLVNNAGTIMAAPLENFSLDDFEKAMRTNFWGAVYTTLEVIPEMRRRRSGRIVNISSIGGKMAVPHLLPYTTSKFALSGFSQGLRIELAKDRIAVTTVYPGLMRTGSPRNADFKGKQSLEHTWFILADSLPGSSINTKSAARKIVAACIAGRDEVALGLPAQLALAMRTLAPGLLNRILAGVNAYFLPSSESGDSDVKKGFESETAITRSPLTALTRAAERDNNEL